MENFEEEKEWKLPPSLEFLVDECVRRVGPILLFHFSENGLAKSRMISIHSFSNFWSELRLIVDPMEILACVLLEYWCSMLFSGISKKKFNFFYCAQAFYHFVKQTQKQVLNWSLKQKVLSNLMIFGSP